MNTLRLHDLEAAARLLKDGQLVAFPTETVYGLGADATSDAAVAAIYAAKERPGFNPLIVHGRDREMLSAFVEFAPLAEKLTEALWPGSLTIVLKRKANCPISLLVSAGLDTIAVRVPNHALAQSLLAATDLPIAAPSANRSSEVSPTTAGHVLASLNGRIAAVLDGGACTVGIESTVVDLSTDTPTLLRPGGEAVETIESIIGPLARPFKDPEAPKSPGMLARHYAPGCPVRLNASDKREGEAYLAFGPTSVDFTLNLSERSDTVEAASNLFAMLRALDRPEFTGIAVAPIPGHKLGLAINDRLKRAATQE